MTPQNATLDSWQNTFLIRFLSTSFISVSIFSVCCYSRVSISLDLPIPGSGEVQCAKRGWGQHRVHIGVEQKQEECICPLSWSEHHNFVHDGRLPLCVLCGRYSERGRACIPHPTLQRQFRLYIPFLGIARSQPQFTHSCVCEQFIYSQDRSTYFLQQKRQTHRGNI